MQPIRAGARRASVYDNAHGKRRNPLGYILMDVIIRKPRERIRRRGEADLDVGDAGPASCLFDSEEEFLTLFSRQEFGFVHTLVDLRAADLYVAEP